MSDDRLLITDEDGDTLQVGPDCVDTRLLLAVDNGPETSEVYLTPRDARRLRDHLTDWLGDQPDSTPDAEADGYTWGTPSIAHEAHQLVYGPRHDDYGHPREDFTRTAVLWTGLLQHLLADGLYVEADDVARCMIAVKLARDVHQPKRDNRVDIAGYAITLDRLETGQ